METPKLTIAIPSFNRGKRALAAVDALLPITKDKGVQILVVNDGSYEQTQEYAKLSKMKGVKYRKKQRNGGFLGSFLTCVEEADGDLLIMLSDEDTMLESGIDYFLGREWDGVAVGRASVHPVGTNNGGEVPSMVGRKGVEAIQLVMNNRYLTGNYFNMKLLKESGILSLLDSDTAKLNKDYPHIYLAMLAASVGDAEFVSEYIAETGEEEDTVRLNIFDHPYSFGARLDQHLVTKENIKQIIKYHGFVDSWYAPLYDASVYYHSFLVKVSTIPLYQKEGLDTSSLELIFNTYARDVR